VGEKKGTRRVYIGGPEDYINNSLGHLSRGKGTDAIQG